MAFISSPSPSHNKPVKLAGVVGWPIHHSLSPLLHTYWIDHLAPEIRDSTKHIYTLFALPPHEAKNAFQSLKSTDICGLNVTLPLKEIAYECVDVLTPQAQNIGACNCLYVREGKLIGHNTDSEGFSAPLRTHLGKHSLDENANHTDIITSNPVFIIGAGGAARACVHGLLAMGVKEIYLSARTDKRAQQLCAQINSPHLQAIPWTHRQEKLGECALLVNASAGGQQGQSPLDIDPSGLFSARSANNTHALVYDLIYTPTHTPLLQASTKAGLHVLGGLDMLIAQARPSFELFFGENVPENTNVHAHLTAHLHTAKKRKTP